MSRQHISDEDFAANLQADEYAGFDEPNASALLQEVDFAGFDIPVTPTVETRGLNKSDQDDAVVSKRAEYALSTSSSASNPPPSLPAAQITQITHAYDLDGENAYLGGPDIFPRAQLAHDTPSISGPPDQATIPGATTWREPSLATIWPTSLPHSPKAKAGLPGSCYPSNDGDDGQAPTRQVPSQTRTLSLVSSRSPTPTSYGMPIYVKLLSGERLTLYVERGDTITSLKVKIQKQVGYPPDQLRLIGQGKALKDWSTVGECNICKGDILHLMLRLRSATHVDVELPTGKRLIVNTQPSDTVASLKKQIQNTEGYAPDRQCLFFHDKEIEDSRTLSGLKISGEFTLKLALHIRGCLRIYIETLTGKKFTLDAEFTESIASIKKRIQKTEGYSPDHQRLIFAGKQLEDDCTLDGCNIQRESTLQLKLRPRRGRAAMPLPYPTTSLADPVVLDTRAQGQSYVPPSPVIQVMMQPEGDAPVQSALPKLATSLTTQNQRQLRSSAEIAALQQAYRVGLRRKLLQPLGSHDTPAFSSKEIDSWINSGETYAGDANKQIHGHIVHFAVGKDKVHSLSSRFPVSSITNSSDALVEMDQFWHTSTGGLKPSFRWVHLPANNMEWVTDAIFQTEHHRTKDPHLASRIQSSILSDKYWAGKQEGGLDPSRHSRFMRSFCGRIETPRVMGDSCFASDTSWVVYMPFLHWETTLAMAQTKFLISDVNSQIPPLLATEIAEMDCTPDEKQLRRYLNSSQPLHPRRSLDSFFHQGLKGSSMRDMNQVVDRYVRKHFSPFPKGPPMLVVDQLWMWVTGNDTVVTAFPQRWNTATDQDSNNEVIDDILEILDFETARNKFRSVFDLASFIVDRCAANCFESYQLTDQHLRFLDIFNDSIVNLIERQNSCLRAVWRKIQSGNKQSLDSLFDISGEYEMLQEIKNVQDELQMLSEVVECQLQTLQQLPNEMPLASIFLAPNNVDTKGWNKDQLLRKAEARKLLLTKLREKAQATYQSILDLLNAKQHQANIFEARSSRKAAQQMEKLAREAESAAKEDRRQGDAIMLFTVVTIFFLPFSALTSVFGMNASNFGQGDLSLRIIFAYILPISAAVTSFALLLALNLKVRRLLMLVLQLIFALIALVIPANLLDGVMQSLDNTVQKLQARRSCRRTTPVAESVSDGSEEETLKGA